MKLSLAATQALGFVYKESKGIDYSKYSSIKLNAEPIFTYILANVGMLHIGSLVFDYMKRLGYIQYTECEGSIIKVFLNQKYFDDLENKQEI